MILPSEHPLRHVLNAELHARQPEALSAPLRLTFLALYSDPSQRAAELEHVGALAVRHGVPPPPQAAAHFSADLGAFRLKFERHSEFTRYKFIAAGAVDAPFEDTALRSIPADWLACVPGRLMVATHVLLVPAPAAHARRGVAGGAPLCGQCAGRRRNRRRFGPGLHGLPPARRIRPAGGARSRHVAATGRPHDPAIARDRRVPAHGAAAPCRSRRA